MKPVTPQCGAEVQGIDLAQPLDVATFEELNQALAERCVLFFRDQRMTPEQQKALGYNFNMVAIPDEVKIGNDPLAFDPEQMRAAFDAGRAMAKKPAPWLKLPPNVGDLPPWALKAIQNQR